MNWKEKFKSPVLWIGIGSMIAFIVKQFGLDIQPQVDEALDIILPIIAMFSAVNNPDSRSSM